jgi:hypothetical protein
MTIAYDRVYDNFQSGLEELKSATSLTKAQTANKLASQVDLLTLDPEGIRYLFDHVHELESAGMFENSPWEDPEKQVPSLVKGTLLSGHPHSSMEILSELRTLTYAQGQVKSPKISQIDAAAFIEEILVLNLEFAFDELNEESRQKLTSQERRKVVNHFKFLLEHAQLDSIKGKLASEIKMVCAQRPLVTTGIRSLIETVYQKLDISGDNKADEELKFFVDALYYPGNLAIKNPNYEAYRTALQNASKDELKAEAKSAGKFLHSTGLTNPYLAMLLRHCVSNHPKLIPHVLHLSVKGESDWEKHRAYVTDLIETVFGVNNFKGIYGLKRMLERSLFSRRAVCAGITNLKLVSLNPKVEKRILKSVGKPDVEVDAMQYLLAAVIGLLGQPLGIGQGNNATCQSARGISMWAQHAPAKLLNMITTVATANNLIMRFENGDLESMKLGKGLVDKLDHNLDAVSVILVPHLDKIYNEMMRRAAGRGEDPHRWVNPALYGHWIHTGFASAYSYLTDSIQDYDGFVKLFLAAFHPDFNGGREMVYPNPVGIFITSSKGEMLGFHAVSLLRIKKLENGETRAYFLNPNNEGRQNWGQGIKPTVYGHGERHGESSLPVEHFLARVYAFHFNRLNAMAHLNDVSPKIVDDITKLAQESWGKSYTWSKIAKQW